MRPGALVTSTPSYAHEAVRHAISSRLYDSVAKFGRPRCLEATSMIYVSLGRSKNPTRRLGSAVLRGHLAESLTSAGGSW